MTQYRYFHGPVMTVDSWNNKLIWKIDRRKRKMLTLRKRIIAGLYLFYMLFFFSLIFYLWYDVICFKLICIHLHDVICLSILKYCFSFFSFTSISINKSHGLWQYVEHVETSSCSNFEHVEWYVKVLELTEGKNRSPSLTLNN